METATSDDAKHSLSKLLSTKVSSVTWSLRHEVGPRTHISNENDDTELGKSTYDLVSHAKEYIESDRVC
jgi:hypothetical protein